MNGFYQLDIEAFPDNQTIYATLEPTEVDDNASFFSFEIERDEVMLAKMLRKLNAYSDLQTPMPSFRSFSRETLKKNINTCYCQGDNIRDIIELYQNRNITPNKEFPGATTGKTQDEYENDADHHFPFVVFLQDSSQSAIGDYADPGASFLDSHHHRQDPGCHP